LDPTKWSPTYQPLKSFYRSSCHHGSSRLPFERFIAKSTVLAWRDELLIYCLDAPSSWFWKGEKPRRVPLDRLSMAWRAIS
jgi:hypothetical protein